MSNSFDLNDHYLHPFEPDEIAGFLSNDDGLSYEEALLQQASMYQSFQERPQNNNVVAHDDVINNSGHRFVGEGERTRSGDVLAHFSLDEDMAISLQNLGDALDDLFFTAPSSIASGSAGSPIATPSRAQASSSNSRQDSVDPDRMEYEELVELSESVGVENRGIAASRIAELPTSKYKSGSRLFSKGKKKEKCVVCQMDFHSGEQLITLPCLHRYHSKCIIDWLMLKKNCPICQHEVVKVSL